MVKDMRKWIRGILLVICLGVMCYSGYQLYTIYSAYSQAEKVYADTSDKYVRPAAGKTESTDPSAPTQPLRLAPIQVDFDALLQENKDVKGWIYVPDTNLNYPIVQAEDNDYYLRRMLDGNYNHSGSIFMDYRNNEKFTDYNSIIYGHNMNNDSMFAMLSKYQKQEFYEEHPVMYLLTPDADYQLDIIASVQVGADSDLYTFPQTREEFDDYLNRLMKKSVLSLDVDLEAVERTVMLSTCSYEYQDARYVVVASMTKLDRLPQTAPAE